MFYPRNGDEFQRHARAAAADCNRSATGSRTVSRGKRGIKMQERARRQLQRAGFTFE